MSEPSVVIADSRLDPDQFMLANIDTSEKPHYTVSELAKFFFGRSPHWIRWREREGYFVLDGDPECEHRKLLGMDIDPATGEPTVPKYETTFIDQVQNAKGKWVEVRDEEGALAIRRVCTQCGGQSVGTHRTDQGFRYYTLSDIEKMAHALASRDAIDGSQFGQTLLLVKTSAQIYRYLP